MNKSEITYWFITITWIAVLFMMKITRIFTLIRNFAPVSSLLGSLNNPPKEKPGCHWVIKVINFKERKMSTRGQNNEHGLGCLRVFPAYAGATDKRQKRQQQKWNNNKCNQQPNKPHFAKIAIESLQLLLEQQTNAKNPTKRQQRQQTSCCQDCLRVSPASVRAENKRQTQKKRRQQKNARTAKNTKATT